MSWAKNTILAFLRVLLFWGISILILMNYDQIVGLSGWSLTPQIFAIVSINIIADVLTIYFLHPSRTEKNIGAIPRFIFGNAPIILGWMTIFILSFLLGGCGCAGVSCFCAFMIPMILYVPYSAYAILLGLISIFMGDFYEGKKIPLLGKICIAIPIILLAILLYLIFTGFDGFLSRPISERTESDNIRVAWGFIQLAVVVLSMLLSIAVVYHDMKKKK